VITRSSAPVCFTERDVKLGHELREQFFIQGRQVGAPFIIADQFPELDPAEG
jgi:hypothetical protein